MLVTSKENRSNIISNNKRPIIDTDILFIQLKESSRAPKIMPQPSSCLKKSNYCGKQHKNWLTAITQAAHGAAEGGRERGPFTRSFIPYFSSQTILLTSRKWSFCIRWWRPCWRRPGTREEDIMARKRRVCLSSSLVVVEQLIAASTDFLYLCYYPIKGWLYSFCCK